MQAFLLRRIWTMSSSVCSNHLCCSLKVVSLFCCKTLFLYLRGWWLTVSTKSSTCYFAPDLPLRNHLNASIEHESAKKMSHGSVSWQADSVMITSVFMFLEEWQGEIWRVCGGAGGSVSGESAASRWRCSIDGGVLVVWKTVPYHLTKSFYLLLNVCY